MGFRSVGDIDRVADVDDILIKHKDHWLINEIIQYLKRTLKRLDLASRSLVTLVEPGSCFAGTLLELVFAADRSYMLDGTFQDGNDSPAVLRTTKMNFEILPMCNDLTRLQTRFLNQPEEVKKFMTIEEKTFQQ